MFADFQAGFVQVTTGYGPVSTEPAVTLPALPGSNNITTIPYADVSIPVSCTSTYQALVLDRSNPTVKLTSWCGESVADMQTAVKASLGRALGQGDLVVFGTSPGRVASGLDTTSLGGSDYTKLLPDLYPQQYIILGVNGSATGTAQESYSTTDVGALPYSPRLKGTLVLDSNEHYNFVPSDEASFAVISGASPQVQVGSYVYTPPTGTNAGFWVLVLDRQTLQPVNFSMGSSVATCVTTQTTQACGSAFDVSADGGADLATFLTAISRRNLIFLTTIGCPFTAASSVSSNLGNAIQNIGGARYTLNALNAAAGTNTCAYALVTANDGNHQWLGSKAALSASQFSAQGQLGAIHGDLARDNNGLYDVAGQDQFFGTSLTEMMPSVDSTFENVASSYRSDWLGFDAPDRLTAYHDISYQLLTDPAIAETGSHLYDVRYFYTDVVKANALANLIDTRLAPTATNPVKPSSWDANNTKFDEMRQIIMAELQQVKSVTGYLTGADGNSGLRGLLNGGATGSHALATAFAVADDVGQDQNDAQQQLVSMNMSDLLNLSAGIISGIAPIVAFTDPEAAEIATILGVMSGTFWTGSAAMTPLGVQTSNIPGAETPYDVQLSSVVNDASQFVTNALDGFDAAVDNILSDGNKLARIATLTSNSDSGWSIANLANGDAIANLLGDGLRRSLWLDILPQNYGVRVGIAKDSANPATFGSWYVPSHAPRSASRSTRRRILAAACRQRA